MLINSAANTVYSRRSRYSSYGQTSAPTGRFLILGILAIFFSQSAVFADTASPSQSGSCNARGNFEKSRVKYVIDGDTVILADERHVRLIGINAPEMGHEGESSQSGAREARDYLDRLLQKLPEIRLQYDIERHDHYGRTLAHLFLQDNSNIQALLLERGLVTPLTIPPNLGFLDCYQGRAEAARHSGKGLWSLSQYQPVPAGQITQSHAGYRIVTGTVRSVGENRSATRINLTPHFALRILREDQPYFEEINLDDLGGKRIRARGFINHHNSQFLMRIRHPADLRVYSAPGRH